MGYLLKEALKTLCGVNQWSYAVFWKIGCQNPKLLIWEDCFYETASCSGLSGSWVSAGTCKLQSTDKTVAVIPVLPHGVVQFGSFSTIMENIGFINDATSLLLQLGYLSELPKEFTPNPIVNAPNCSFDTSNYVESSMVDSQASFSFASEIQNELRAPNSQIGPQHYPKITPPAKLDFSSSNQLINDVAKAEVITSNLYSINPGHISTPNGPSAAPRPGSIYYPGSNTALGSKSEIKQDNTLHFVEDDEKRKSGDDLFDVLGADFKNKLFSNCWNNNKRPGDESGLHARSNISESEIFSSANSDNLLEAIVSTISSSAKRSLIDDNVSCSTDISSSSGPNSSIPLRRFGISDHMKGELFGVPKFIAKAGPSKDESGSYSQGSSIYGSQISSWIGKNQKVKQSSNSVSTGYSKKLDETGKTNRKRLKPGENPRPRPKDRQMIQDRVKELREIVPNGAKCSIDALLERTIKHMLFLQSVTKHADKLKQTGESKFISKDGGLLLKDNFEGGATWAYEVGSQSMVCPIIVEDLNQPRQMLVEMLCEERGLFLEIADIIRGLGLTILKGVMETRNDKIWARFAVEANRDVTRMEIFISLVRLLEQSAKNISPQPNGGTTTENVMAQQFHQIAPIPVRSHSLQ
ncbi:transcription factor lhw [Phtheirospermum japonicum]|uniref:Transcription factor lhw n=1 Tax=Phtheirospermum japonicum TaxID=374723 RepID=A0A830DBX2_9LAMI|nr:transcription factor lhw [Phtheirospermum japonicum]